MNEIRKCLYCQAEFQVDRLAEVRKGGKKQLFCCSACKSKYYTAKGKRGRGWGSLRKDILAGDGNKCVLCGREDDLGVHHIEKYSETGNNRMDNLVSLCQSCHTKEHNRMERFKRPSRKILEYVDSLKKRD